MERKRTRAENPEDRNRNLPPDTIEGMSPNTACYYCNKPLTRKRVHPHATCFACATDTLRKNGFIEMKAANEVRVNGEIRTTVSVELSNPDSILSAIISYEEKRDHLERTLKTTQEEIVQTNEYINALTVLLGMN